jgi:hypothetical protein
MPTNINGNTGIDKVQDGTVVSADIDTLDASKLTGSIAAARIASNTIDSAHIASGAVDDAHLATGITASKLTGTIADARFPSTLPAASAANLTAIPAANITGTLPAINGASLTGISGGLVLVGSSVNMDSGGTTFTAVNIDQCFTSTYQNYMIVGTWGVEANGTTKCRLRTGSAGSESSVSTSIYKTAGYDWQNENGTLSAAAVDEENDNEFVIAEDCTPHISDGNAFTMFVNSPQRSDADCMLTYTGNTYDAQNDIRLRFLAANIRGLQATGISFYTNNGNIDEHAIRVYGIVDS